MEHFPRQAIFGRTLWEQTCMDVVILSALVTLNTPLGFSVFCTSTTYSKDVHGEAIPQTEIDIRL